MKKSLLFVQLNESGEPKEGDWQELLSYLAINDMDKIVLAGAPNRMLRTFMQEFDHDGSLVEVIEHPDALAAVLQGDDYEVTNFDEDCCGY